jgi:hypothetical protein
MKLNDLLEARYHGRPHPQTVYDKYNEVNDRYHPDDLWDQYRMGLHYIDYDENTKEVAMMISLDSDDATTPLPTRREATDSVKRFIEDNDLTYDKMQADRRSESGITQWQFIISYNG